MTSSAVDPKTLKKAFHTACCIIPPKELWDPIQRIRSVHDSAYQRWMPHINLMFPFVHPDGFSVAHSALTEALKTFEPFDISLEQFSHFEHKKNCVLWLYPGTTATANDSLQPSPHITQLLQAMVSVLPQCDDQLKKNEQNTFFPHLTLGQFAKSELDRKQKEFRASWPGPLQWKVNEVYIISRNGPNAPFQVDYTVSLGGWVWDSCCVGQLGTLTCGKMLINRLRETETRMIHDEFFVWCSRTFKPLFPITVSPDMLTSRHFDTWRPLSHHRPQHRTKNIWCNDIWGWSPAPEATFVVDRPDDML